MSGRGTTHSPVRFYQDLLPRINSSYALIINKPYNLCQDELNQLCLKIDKFIRWLSNSIDSDDDEKEIRKVVTSIYKLMFIYANKLLEKFQHSKSKTHNKFDLMESDSMQSVYNLLRENDLKLLRRDMQDALTRQVAHEFFKKRMLSEQKLKECFTNMHQKYTTLTDYDQNRAFSLLYQAGCKRDEDGNILPRENFNSENETFEWLQKQVHYYVIKLAHDANISLKPAQWSMSFYDKNWEIKMRQMHSIISELRKDENLDKWKEKFECRVNQLAENSNDSPNDIDLIRSARDLIKSIESRSKLLLSNGTLDLTPSDYKNRIVEYLEHFIRTLNDFSKYSSLCQNLIDHQLTQARSRFFHNYPPRKLETRDNFLSHQSTPSLQNRATNSRTNHVQLPIGSNNANANQNNQSPRENLNWTILSKTPSQKCSPTLEVPFNVKNQDTKPTNGTNRKSHV